METISGVTLIHMDDLCQIKDNTLERRKEHIPAAEAIIEAVKEELTTHALKDRLTDIAAVEPAFEKKKKINLNQDQAEVISSRIIQKITSHFVNYLKHEDTMLDESIEFIEKVF